uniref:Uncharacterized protein n=1 Tax=Meloidogyne hapla TaxID=6305 RepID=A0A1I8BIH6_MELHA
MSKDGDEELIRTLEGMLGRISKEIHTNTNIIEYSFLKDIFKFKKSLIKLNGALEVILNKVDVVGTEYAPQVVPQFPKIKRVFWFVRHGEKLDNDPAVKQTARQEKCYREGDRTFALDNSPLSDTGKSRAALLNGVFGNINIQHLFASPYERTVQTALNLLGNSHIKYDSNGNPQNYLEIKLEPGFMESMTFLESSKSPIGFDIDELNIHYEDYRIDWGHKSILDRSDLEEYKETSIVKVVELDQDSTSEHGASSSGHGASSSSSTGINYLENLRLVHFGATKQFAEVFDEDNDYFEH